MTVPLIEAAGAIVVGREWLYGAMLANPCARWTVGGLAGIFPGESPNRLRTALLLLVGDQLAEIADGGTVLGVRLTTDGRAVLRALAAARGRPGVGMCPGRPGGPTPIFLSGEGR